MIKVFIVMIILLLSNCVKKGELYLENKAWWNMYSNYAKKLGIVISPIVSNNERQRFLPYMYDLFIITLRDSPLLFSILRSIKNWISIKNHEPLLETKIYEKNGPSFEWQGICLNVFLKSAEKTDFFHIFRKF